MFGRDYRPYRVTQHAASRFRKRFPAGNVVESFERSILKLTRGNGDHHLIDLELDAEFVLRRGEGDGIWFIITVMVAVSRGFKQKYQGKRR